MLGALCLAATIAYVQRNSISVAESTIRQDLQLTKQQSSWVIMAFFLTYTLVQLPAGWLGHRLGSRWGLSLFAAAWSLATGAMALCQGLIGLVAVRLGMGAAQAGVFPCATSSIAQWFPPTRRSFASGALGAFMSVGGFVGAIISGYLLVKVGWRGMFALYAAPGIVFALWFAWWFRDRPEQHAGVGAAELAFIRGQRRAAISEPPQDTPDETAHVESPREPTPWSAILSSQAMWSIGGQQFCRAAGYMFFGSWFATYLQEQRHVSIPTSGVLTGLPLLAAVLGSLAGGAISDVVYSRTGSLRAARQILAASSMFACAGLIFASYFIDDVYLAVGAISAGAFFAAFGGPCAYTITIDLGGRHVTTVFSFMNMLGNLGAVLFILIVPPLEKLPTGWDGVLFLFALLYVAAGVFWLAFNSTRSIVPEKS